MSDTIIVVELETEVVTVVEPGPRGPAGVGGEEIAADLADETAARIAADEALQTAIDDISVEETDPVATAALATHAASTTAHGIGTAAALASDTDNTLAANSDSRLATQKATKGYITTQTGLLVPKSLVDAKGDLLVGTADNTVARKAVGSDGKVLVADSGQSDGLNWGYRRTLTDPDLPTGAIAQTWSRQAQAASANATIGSGNLHIAGSVVIPAGRTPASITFFALGTAANSPTNQWFCLLTRDLSTAVYKTADDTSTAWSANTAKTLTLSSAPTPSVDTAYYVGVMVAAGTPPVLAGVNGPNANVAGVAPAAFGRSTTSLTTPGSFSLPATSLTVIGVPIWCYVS